MKIKILFRGKRIDNGEWVEGYYYANPIETLILPLGHEISVTLDSVKVIPETIGQFTGLTDSDIDGSLVFEGDVIENCDTKQLQVVFWHEEKAAWYCRYIIDSDRIVSLANSIGNLNKVIGNIHDNPELLK